MYLVSPQHCLLTSPLLFLHTATSIEMEESIQLKVNFKCYFSDDVAYHQILTMLVGEQGWGWLLNFCDCFWEAKKGHVRVIARWANVTTKEPKDFWSVRTPHWYAQWPGNRLNVAHHRNWACHHCGSLQQSVGLWEIMFAKVDYVECTMRWL